jgi:hypothetical protein
MSPQWVNQSSQINPKLIQQFSIISASFRRMSGPLLLEIEKVPGVDFGTKLAIRKMPGGEGRRRRAVVVKGIVPASIADRFREYPSPIPFPSICFFFPYSCLSLHQGHPSFMVMVVLLLSPINK